MKKCYLSVLFLTVVILFAGICYAVELKIGGDLEVAYSDISLDTGRPQVGGIQIEQNKFYTTDVDLNFKAIVDEKTEVFVKIDADDLAGGKVDSNGNSMLEEINFTFKDVANAPLTIKVGKQEVAFGQDKDLSISYPYMHNSASSKTTFLNGVFDIDQVPELDDDGNTVYKNDKIYHFGEVDNKFAVKLTTTPVEGAPKIELTVFQNDKGQSSPDGTEPADTGVQSYAARMTSTRVPGLKAEVSYISMHEEGAHNTEGMVDNSSALSVGFYYEYDPIALVGEVIAGKNLNHVKDYDQDIYQIGLAVTPVDKFTVVAQYHKLVYKDNINQTEPWLDKITITPKYKLDNGVDFALEYAREVLHVTDDFDADDISADVVAGRIGYHF